MKKQRWLIISVLSLVILLIGLIGVSMLYDGSGVTGNPIFEVLLGLNSNGESIYIELNNYDCNDDCSNKIFKDYLKYYQVRYNSINSTYPLAYPIGKVGITIGGSFEGANQYIYVSIAEIHAHETYSNWSDRHNYVYNEVVALNSLEVEAIFNGKTSVTQDKIQRADMEKLHSQLIVEHPEWYVYGNELNFGVLTYANGSIILDEDNKPINDSNDSYYQQGKTIVLPTGYNLNYYPTRVHLNYNNPTVREYAIRFILKKISQSKNNKVFIDNSPISIQMLFQDGNYRKSELHYISDGNWTEQTKIYVNNSVYIYREVKKRGNNPEIIKNGLRSQSGFSNFATHYLVENSFDSIDGMMIENRFWQSESEAFEDKWGLTGYLNWSSIFGNAGKKIFYAASVYDFSEVNAYDVWLMANLIGNDNSYFYISKNAYNGEDEEFLFQNFSIGLPLTDVYKGGDTLYRRFQRGLIAFNVTIADVENSGLNAISFTEDPYCPDEICNNNFDDNCDGIIDNCGSSSPNSSSFSSEEPIILSGNVTNNTGLTENKSLPTHNSSLENPQTNNFKFYTFLKNYWLYEVIGLIIISLIILTIFLLNKAKDKYMWKAHIEAAKQGMLQLKEAGHSNKVIRDKFVASGWSYEEVSDILRDLNKRNLKDNE